MDPTKLGYSDIFSLHNIGHVIEKLAGQSMLKAIIAVALWVLNWFFGSDQELVAVVLLLVLFDTATGLLKAYKKSNISSSGFFRFALKIVVYSILMSSAALLDKLAGSLFIKAFPVVAAFLGLTEGISIFENVSASGFAVPQWMIKAMRLANNTTKDSTPEKGEEVIQRTKERVYDQRD